LTETARVWTRDAGWQPLKPTSKHIANKDRRQNRREPGRSHDHAFPLNYLRRETPRPSEGVLQAHRGEARNTWRCYGFETAQKDLLHHMKRIPAAKWRSQYLENTD
jgi:hypothetical protein